MQVNSNISYTGLVEKYIGTAYDQMSELHQNLADLLIIAESMKDGSFQEVAAIADEIATLIAKIDGFNSTYYGALDYMPTLDPMGNPITEGDLYYDLNLRMMQVYVTGDWWIPLGAVNHTVIRVVLDSSHFPDGANGEILVNLGYDLSNKAYAYIPGTNNINVHLEGKLLVSTHIAPVAGGYTETSDHAITIHGTRLSTEAKEGDEVVISIATEVATVTHIGEVGRYILYTQTAGETTFSVPGGATYIPGSNNLTVHLKPNDGSERELQVIYNEDTGMGDYIETSPTTFTFVRTLKQTTEVLMTIGHIVANDDAHFEVLMREDAPDEMLYNEGQLWFRTTTGRMYILYFDDTPLPEAEDPGDGSIAIHVNRQWVSITPEDTIIGPEYEVPLIPPTPVIHGTIFQDTAPDPTKHAEGTLWFNIKTGNLHIKYQDLDTQQWVKVST